MGFFYGIFVIPIMIQKICELPDKLHIHITGLFIDKTQVGYQSKYKIR
ncbi:Hypothetical protein I595_1707 [Croceitalea dokdonensis DOKDO 023]|uniref:Uncharacterized protein n=1 Tax=Croceitalea dokdonensis DOKDO 023 TaxID=1300341 RepID=A0A0P7B1X9_9FLAO|nr:Hypothetical protein I595_1707 [Croceitalea dokdonensis DOKDO 023]